MEEEFDIVEKVLKEQISKLRTMTMRNTEWGIMDHIRLDQIKQLEDCMKMWKRGVSHEQAV